MRRLNRVRIPIWAAEGKPGPADAADVARGSEAVLFRPRDPRALGSILPVLTPV